MPDEPPREPAPQPATAPKPPLPPLPPLLDYPSRPPPPEPEGERWSDFFRALVIVFGTIALIFIATFGLCGLLGRGCG